MRRIVYLFLSVAITLFSQTARADSTSLLGQAKAANATRYQFAVSNNAEIRNTSDNKAFTIWWQPSSSTPSGVIVTLHGHGSYATDEFYLWQPYLQTRGYAILALQWWFGGGETVTDYYLPQEMYPIVANLLKEKGVKPGTVLFHGYSRGSANSYAMTALDTASGNRYFSMTLSNSGGAHSDFPPNQQIVDGVYGSLPFSGVQWVMYCGELDPDPTLSGCPAMTAAKDWVTKYGATFKLLIDDPVGGHGGFMTNGANVNTALAQFVPNTPAPAPTPVCTLTATPTSIFAGGTSTLSASCSPTATSYVWSGSTCAGTSGASCAVTPAASTTYSVIGSNAAGSGNTASTTVTVRTGAAGVTADSGIWWYGNESGRGFSIEVQGNALFLGAFLYDTSGRSTWYMSAGGIQSDGTYLGPLQSYGNGQTLTGVYKAPTLTNDNAGSVTLRFSDANHGTLTWPGGSIAIERFVFDSGTPSFKPETGMWWNATESGRGFLIEVQGTTLWMGGYMYDGAGNPVWYSTSGPMTSTTFYQGHWDQYSGGQTLTGAYKAPGAPTNAGTVKLQFNTSSRATLTLPDARQIQLTRFNFAPAASP